MPTMTPALVPAATPSGPACAAEPEVMFPPVDSQLAGRPNTAELRALAVCHACPVLERCRADVLSARLSTGVAGGLTVADRRAIRAQRRGLTADQVSAPENPPAPQPQKHVPVTAFDAALDAVLAAHAPHEHGADSVRVRELAAGRGVSAAAQRWEVALAAATRLRLGHGVSTTARELGEQYTQVRRWRDRDRAGEALVLGARRGATDPVAAGPESSADRRDPTGRVADRGVA